MDIAADDGTTVCESCQADDWVHQRPSLPAGVVKWLGTGGPWRPTRTICRACGASASSGADWTIMLGDTTPSRWTLPGRVVRAVVRTIEGHRRAHPVPWVYLVAALVGGTAGGVLGRARRRVVATVAGAAGGAVACWSAFAWTARGASGLVDELVIAALQEVSPERAATRRRTRDVALMKKAHFAVYRPIDAYRPMHGGHSLAVSTDGSVVTSVQLVHGDLADAASPWVMVTCSAQYEGGEGHDEGCVADELRELALLGSTGDDSILDTSDLWHGTSLIVDGRSVSARLLRRGRYWSAIARVKDVEIVVHAHDVPIDVPFERVPNLAERYVGEHP